MVMADRLTAIAESRAALVVAGAWGFAEAILFFVVPDVWVAFVAGFSPRRAIPVLLATTMGAVAGAAVLYLGVPTAPWLTDAFIALPGVHASDLARVDAAIEVEGWLIFTGGIPAGDPVKLAIRAAALAGLPLTGVLVAVALNRLVRVGMTALIFGIIGTVFRGPIHRHPAVAMALYAACWIGIYAVYWTVR